jgi:hypothetical protein
MRNRQATPAPTGAVGSGRRRSSAAPPIGADRRGWKVAEAHMRDALPGRLKRSSRCRGGDPSVCDYRRHVAYELGERGRSRSGQV